MTLSNSTGNVAFPASIDVDGTTNLDVVDIDGAVDMATTLQVTGNLTTSANNTFSVTNNTAPLTLVSTDTDASAGPFLDFWRNSSSPADNDYIGEIRFYGENDNDEAIVYAGLAARILDASDGTEDGRFELYTERAGTQTSMMATMADEIVFNNDSIDLDFRVESDGNANSLFLNADTGRVAVGHNSPQKELDVRGELAISNSTTSYWNLNRNDSDGDLTFSDTGTEAMRLTVAGRLGVGISTPDCRLHVRDGDAGGVTAATGSVLCLESNGDAILQFLTPNANNQQIRFGDPQDTGAGFIDYDHNSSLLSFAVNGPAKMSINSSGTTSMFAGTSNVLQLNTSSGTTGTNNYIRCESESSLSSDGDVRFVVFANGNVQNSNNSYGAISDQTKKENIVDATEKLESLKKVKIRNFNFIGDDLKQIGVVAQELETIFPSMVEDIKDQDSEGVELETSTKSVKYSVFVPILIKAIQEQQELIETLQTKVAALEGE